MARNVVAAAALVIAFLASASPALACSIASPTLEEVVARSRLIVEATVLRVVVPAEFDLSIERVFKGDPGAPVVRIGSAPYVPQPPCDLRILGLRRSDHIVIALADLAEPTAANAVVWTIGPDGKVVSVAGISWSGELTLDEVLAAILPLLPETAAQPAAAGRSMTPALAILSIAGTAAALAWRRRRAASGVRATPPAAW